MMGPKPIPVADRILSKVVKSGDCWQWVGAIKENGYGVILDQGVRRMVYVHRKMFELFYYKIPDGLVIDHLCRNRACCKPSHLQAVTQKENLLRGENRNFVTQRTGFCARGHEMNLHGKQAKDGRTRCNACRKLRRRN